MRRILALLVLVVAFAACGSRGTKLPECSTGHGTDGSTSTLRIQQNGERFTGTYDVSQASTADEAIRYTVEGTAKDGRLDSTWAVGSAVLKVSGHYTNNEIVLDNPSGQFRTTRFGKGC